MMQLVCFFFLAIAAVSGLPDGAPFCEVGSSSTRTQHLVRSTETGEIVRNKYYKVVLGGVELEPLTPDNPDFVNVFNFNQNLELEVKVDTAAYFKGILVIVSGGNPDDRDSLDTKTPQALLPTGVGTKESIGCENFDVASIVHTEPSEKQSLKGTFKWPVANEKLYLDVNVVKNNNNVTLSQYYYSQYILQGGIRPPPPRTSCGLLGLSIFCPFTFCGVVGRLLGLCRR
jgi:hypothetical protein